MKIAIADRKGSYSDYWIKYCEEHSIPYKAVNPYDTDIVEQVSDCDAFMWHHHHASYRDALFAKQLLFSLEQAGKVVFPNFRTGWHFDDKLGQKYLFEALGVRAAKSWVFYDKKSAYEWIETTDFPKVFKLRGGAGSANVRLARNKKQAKAFVRKALRRGFASSNPLFSAKTQWQNFVKGQGRFYDVAKYIGLYLFPGLNGGRRMPRQKGYAYFQEFIPNDGFDLRVIVIGNKAFAIRRETRHNDFRASGSGEISYERELFNEQLIQSAFEINQQIKSQSLALDFVKDIKTSQLYAVEISYCYSVDGYLKCPGYWTSDLSWHEEHFDSCGWMVEEVMTEIDSQKQF